MSNKSPSEEWVVGRNPVLELLKTDAPVDKLLVLRSSAPAGSLRQILRLARDRQVPVKELPRERFDALFPDLRHQGVAAMAAACPYLTVPDLLAVAEQRGQPPFLVVADGIEDPRNLGAVIRSAEAAGAHGIIIPKRQGAGVTAAVLSASAGAARHLAVARVPNIAATLTELKERGVWVYAADLGGRDWCTVDYSGPAALVVGAEGQGVSRLVRERSDLVVSLPMCGQVGSLNVSVAAGIVLYEIMRQRLNLNAIQKG